MATQKFITLVNGQKAEKMATVVSAGIANAGEIPALDASGKLSTTVMPVGIGATTKVLLASESLLAGDFVSIYDNAGTPNVRKANATDTTKPAHGFVLSAATNGSNATVYVDGINTGLTGLTTGSRYYLSTTAGEVATTAPNAAGNSLQFIGYAIDTSTIQFQQTEGIQLA